MLNGTMMQYFHWYYGNNNGDVLLWQHVKNEAERLAKLGVSALWLPPPYKCAGGAKDVGYGIYDLYDLGEFDQKGSVATKYGSRDQYLEAIEAAHKHKINVYGDVVLNHKAGADRTQWVKAARVHQENRGFSYGMETWIEAWTQFDFLARNNKYSDFKWNYKHFDGVDWAQNNKENAIFKFLGLGKNWEQMVSGEHGNYDYLMFSDIDMNHPEVRTELARWGKWFVETTGVDGFRLDAIKHIQFSFFRDWLAYLRTVFPDNSLFAVGEYWSSNIDELCYYIDKTNGMMSLFDAPLQNKFYDASRAEFGNYDLRSLFDETLVMVHPGLAVTLVDNHDTQPCQALERWVDYWFKPLAYASILLRKDGYPCVFYPDLYGATYEDVGYSISLAPVEKLEVLMDARKRLAYGRECNYFDNPHIVGWTRQGSDDAPGSGLAVLMSNQDGGSKWMEMGAHFAGAVFHDLMGNCSETVTLNEHGWGEFKVAPGSVSVWAL